MHNAILHNCCFLVITQMSYQTAQYLPPSVSSVPQLPPVPGNTTRKEQHFSKNVDQKVCNEMFYFHLCVGYYFEFTISCWMSRWDQIWSQVLKTG